MGNPVKTAWHTWRLELARLATVIVLSLAVGWLVGYPTALLALGLGGHLLWYMYRVAQLAQLCNGRVIGAKVLCTVFEHVLFFIQNHGHGLVPPEFLSHENRV